MRLIIPLLLHRVVKKKQLIRVFSVFVFKAKETFSLQTKENCHNKAFEPGDNRCFSRRATIVLTWLLTSNHKSLSSLVFFRHTHVTQERLTQPTFISIITFIIFMYLLFRYRNKCLNTFPLNSIQIIKCILCQMQVDSKKEVVSSVGKYRKKHLSFDTVFLSYRIHKTPVAFLYRL